MPRRRRPTKPSKARSGTAARDEETEVADETLAPQRGRVTEPFRWDPLGLEDVLALMEPFAAPWWIGGGWALDLHIGRQTREHADVDVIIRRADQELLRTLLAGWDIRVAHKGRLEPWTTPLRRPRHGLWARSDTVSGWQVEFLLAETEGDEWIYRRDENVRVPLADVVLRTRLGVPYLRPEVLLLNKSHDVRDRDELDFAAVLPLLDDRARAWLHDRLPPGHAWRAPLGDPRRPNGQGRGLTPRHVRRGCAPSPARSATARVDRAAPEDDPPHGPKRRARVRPRDMSGRATAPAARASTGHVRGSDPGHVWSG